MPSNCSLFEAVFDLVSYPSVARLLTCFLLTNEMEMEMAWRPIVFNDAWANIWSCLEMEPQLPVKYEIALTGSGMVPRTVWNLDFFAKLYILALSHLV